MIDGLIGGQIHGKPLQRIGKSGKPFVTANIRAATSEGDALFVNVIAFSERVGADLLALDNGDSVSVAGVLTPKVWRPPGGGEPRLALDMVAQAAVTPYHVTRKRQLMTAGGAVGQQKSRRVPSDDGLCSDLPWEA